MSIEKQIVESLPKDIKNLVFDREYRNLNPPFKIINSGINSELKKEDFYLFPWHKRPSFIMLICFIATIFFFYLAFYYFLFESPENDKLWYLIMSIILLSGGLVFLGVFIREIIGIKHGFLLLFSKGILFQRKPSNLKFISWDQIGIIDPHEATVSHPDGTTEYKFIILRLKDGTNYFFNYPDYDKEYGKDFDFFCSVFKNYFNKFSKS
ncbi:MAG: hypothetical protein ACTSQP_12590 [Promethearchaeota archaeon]